MELCYILHLPRVDVPKYEGFYYENNKYLYLYSGVCSRVRLSAPYNNNYYYLCSILLAFNTTTTDNNTNVCNKRTQIHLFVAH